MVNEAGDTDDEDHYCGDGHTHEYNDSRVTKCCTVGLHSTPLT